MIKRAFAVSCVLSCAVKSPGIDPPRDAFYFPTGLAVDPAGRFLYVTNANSDLLYNSGTLLAIDLTRLDGTCPCDPNPLEPGSEVCEEACLVADAVGIGSFANDVRVRAAGDRLYTTVRSDPSGVVWVDLDPAGAEVLSCGQQRLDDNRCDAAHAVDTIARADGEELSLAAEPFGLFLQETTQGPRLLVTHLAVGRVTVVDDCGDELKALDTSDELFPSDVVGRRGAFAIAPRDPGSLAGPFYVTSRIAAQITTVMLDPAANYCDTTTRLVPATAFALPGVADGSDARGLVFAPDGNRAFVVDREPPSLIEIDTSLEEGVPRNRVNRVVELCPEPSVVRLDPNDPRLLLYVVCFATSQIFVVDGDAMQVEAVIATGRGPNDLVFDPQVELHRAYLAQFAENTIGIIDLDPESTRYRTVVRRIGTPEPLR